MCANSTWDPTRAIMCTASLFVSTPKKVDYLCFFNWSPACWWRRSVRKIKTYDLLLFFSFSSASCQRPFCGRRGKKTKDLPCEVSFLSEASSFSFASSQYIFFAKLASSQLARTPFPWSTHQPRHPTWNINMDAELVRCRKRCWEFIYGLWLARNNVRDGKKITDPRVVAESVFNHAQEWASVHAKQATIKTPTPVERCKQPDQGIRMD